MKIGLRAGHSDNCIGAVGIVDEHQEMKQYYVAVKTMLENNGHTVINCNSNGRTANAELSEGANAANSNNVDLFVSLHMNASDGRGHGIEALVSGTGSGAYSYAQRLCTNFSNLGFTNRGVKCERLYEMNHISAPNIIFEICFCDSQVDIDIFNQYSWDKLAAVFCNAIDSSISIESNATVQGWNKNNTGWWYCTNTANGYYYKDQWKEIDNEWYSFDASGYARQSTWIQDGGKWYWLKNDCKMARSIWLWIDGECYCFDKSGATYINCVTPDGYAVDETGAWDNTIPKKK